MQIPEHLIGKYNTAVPRYTSYPPANWFREFTVKEHIDLISDSNNTTPENIAIYIHIPFCKRICYYCGCNSCSLGKGKQVDSYIRAVLKEIKMASRLLGKSRKVSQVHYGGGTPNAIDLKYLSEINELIRTEFSFIDEPEMAIECNPGYLDFRDIDTLLTAGFNRFSLGIQDFNETVLKMVNRSVPEVPPSDLFAHIKDRNKKASVNFDFIYGLPGQTASSFSETIGEAVKIKPDRIVTFSYAHVPWLKKHQLILEKKGLPGTEEKMQMFLSGFAILKEAGYEPLGLDHFVLPEDDLFQAFRNNRLHRNFQGYCTRRTTGQVYAFGITGISQLEQGYSQNSKDLEKYVNDIENGSFSVEKGYLLSQDQKITREVITRLMCNKRIVFSEIANDFGISAAQLRKTVGYREIEFSEMASDGLLNCSEEGIEVSEKGTMFIRNIAAKLDPDYTEKNQTYSKTV